MNYVICVKHSQTTGLSPNLIVLMVLHNKRPVLWPLSLNNTHEVAPYSSLKSFPITTIRLVTIYQSSPNTKQRTKNYVIYDKNVLLSYDPALQQHHFCYQLPKLHFSDLHTSPLYYRIDISSFNTRRNTFSILLSKN